MDYLFCGAGMEKLETHVRRGMLCLFDFDGTLSPIVGNHEDAVLPGEVASRLRRLAVLTTVGVITGRSVSDARHRLGAGVELPIVIGNHGMEGMPGYAANADRFEVLVASWRRQLNTTFLDQEAWPGILVEDKRYSLSVHYRAAPSHEKARKRLEFLLQRLDPPPRIVGGKCVFNLLPMDAPDKGRALTGLLQHTGSPGAIYVGDDVTDEDVFRLDRPDVFAIRVGEDASSKAPFFLRDFQEILRLLDVLNACFASARP